MSQPDRALARLQLWQMLEKRAERAYKRAMGASDHAHSHSTYLAARERERDASEHVVWCERQRRAAQHTYETQRVSA